MLREFPHILAGVWPRRIRAVGLVTAVLILSACSGLAGEVEIVATAPPAVVPAEAELPLPPAPPDVANGANIYAQNCTSCHGENGAGNGPLVEDGSVPRMPSFLEARHVRQQTPAFYYDIITNGNLVNLMPPWAGSLSLQERWDVAMYTYTLHYSEAQLTRGAALVDAESAPAFSIASDAQIAARYQSAAVDAEAAFAAAAFERTTTLSTVADERVGAASTLEQVTITGTATNGTAGATLPDDLLVTLRYGTLDEGFQVMETSLEADGSYRFSDVPVEAAYNYIVLAIYQNRGFPSAILTAPQITSADITLDVTIYERTEDQNAITLTDLNLLVEPLSVEDLGNGLLISQTNVYRNTSDRFFHLEPNTGVDGAALPPISLLIQIPPGAVFLPGLNDTQRYILAQEQYALIDTAPIFPGEHQVRLTYFLPYDDNAVVDLALNYGFEGMATVQLASSILSLESDTFRYIGETNLGSEAEPYLVQVYDGDFEVAAGDSLQFDLRGTIFASNTSQDGALVTGNVLLPVLLIGGLLIVGGIVLLFWLQGRDPHHAQINQLIRQLAQLDTQHENGQLDDAAYHQQRQQLQARLNALMQEDEQPT